MSALSEGGGGGNKGMVDGLDCNCPDNCDEVIYSQVFHFHTKKFARFLFQEISTGPFHDTNDFFWKNAIGSCYVTCPPHKLFKKEKEALEKNYEYSCAER